MGTTGWVILAVVVAAVLVVAAVGALGYMQTHRRSAMRDRFGPEYDRALKGAGSRRKGERELRRREARYAEMDIKQLSAESRGRFTEAWDRAERLFVDDPELAAREADRVVRNVLDERGYPSDDYVARAEAVSVEHPRVVERYRHGHDMVHSNGRTGRERTENLRKAMVDFRAVFVEMVEPAREELASR